MKDSVILYQRTTFKKIHYPKKIQAVKGEGDG